jgi:hypothetical protein
VKVGEEERREEEGKQTTYTQARWGLLLWENCREHVCAHISGGLSIYFATLWLIRVGSPAAEAEHIVESFASTMRRFGGLEHQVH